MGLIATVLAYARTARNGANVSDVTCDPGGGANRTAAHFQDANTDSVPLPGDFVKTDPAQQTGVEYSVGFIDPDQGQTANPGENRIYARDASGAEVAHVYIQNDGTITASNGTGSVTLSSAGRILGTNGAGYFDLKESGTVDINGFTITPDGAASSPVSVTAPTVAAASSLTKAGVPVADQEHTHGAGGLKDSDGGSVSGTTAESNG